MAIDHKKLLIDHGIRPSIIRLSVYKHLDKTNTHLTVDEIYKDLAEELPTLSKTSVYNVLKLMMEHDLVKSIQIDRNEAFYEVMKEDHIHFKCKVCGNIYDLPKDKTFKLTVPGYLIQEQELTLKGICPNCQNKGELKWKK